MLDGRHTGTGGGNHIVLGGPTPADSPFLRRPDLLKSLIGYWLNHPSLSYLFSGVFIGPTSQAPRVDETRADAVYELELAFSMLDQQQPAAFVRHGWWIEFSATFWSTSPATRIAPSSASISSTHRIAPRDGLGLVEMRAFEMPPHARMSLAQQLLVRALVAWFWRKPYNEKPIRWGTRLHDLFLLAIFRRAGFRHGHWGSAASMVTVSIRHGSIRTSNFVFRSTAAFVTKAWKWNCGRPSSPGMCWAKSRDPAALRAMWIRPWSECRCACRGLVSERFAVTCNGGVCRCNPTGTQGEFVCGVRYRAWQPPRCLHPTIPVHAPLVFDVVDIGNQRSIGGCTYHVAHPGGRHYETFPVNSNEAEARRAARFFAFGHTAGKVIVPALEVNPEFPATLDLRR